MDIQYKRILLKLSGEALAGGEGFGLNQDMVDEICGEIVRLVQAGVEVAVVVGGGNFWRGRKGEEMDRTTADHMGMLATAINALALQDSIEKQGVPVRVQSAIEMNKIAEPYIRRKAMRHLEKGRVVIFACGTGNPFFTTDTAAALRAAEIEADIVLLAKNVDGVYDCDPALNPAAKRYDTLTYRQILNEGLKATDTTAATMCMESNLPVLVFALNPPANIARAAKGERIGTLITAKG